MRCRSCGYVQMPAPRCKRCGHESGRVNTMGAVAEERPMGAPLPTYDAIVRRSLDVYRRNFWPLTFFGGLFWIVFFAGPSLPILDQQQYRVTYLIVAIITILASVMVSYICVIWVSFEALNDRQISPASALRQVGLRNVLRVVSAGGLSAVFTFVGFLALVIPGFVVGVRLSMAGPVVVIEDKGGWQALVRSWQLVKGRGLRVFGSLLVLNLPAMLVGAANQLLTYVATALGPLATTIAALIGLAGSIVAGTFSEVGLTVLYSALVGGMTRTPSELAPTARVG